MIVAIDGPAGAGKSTVARKLAERLGFRVSGGQLGGGGLPDAVPSLLVLRRQGRSGAALW